MARREKSPQPKRSRLKAAKNKMTRSAKKLTSRLRPARRTQEEPIAKPVAAKMKPRKRGDGKAARPTRREADIPLEVLDRTYTPKQTSLKAPFRASGVERERDQELAGGYADERWNDEDRFTNKSGDPRIGTHHRKYEPGE